MLTTALLSALKAVGVQDVSIGDPADRTTWLVKPDALQKQAQPIIDAFNPADPALVAADLDAAVKDALDNQRLISAVLWTVIDQLAGPATLAKYQAARAKIIMAYRTTPWSP